MGGGEGYMLYLAVALSKLPEVKVTILSEFLEITKNKLEIFFNLDLSEIDFEIVEDSSHSLRQIVDGADFFIPLSNFRRINVKPKNYIQALQIPYDRITPAKISAKILKGNLKEGIKDVLRLQLLSHTRRNARLALTYSQFVHDTLKKNFGLDSKILYPPIQDFLIEGTVKNKIILSVGRFFRGLYNDKRYDVLTETFRKVSKAIPEWEYHVVGSASSDMQTQKLLHDLKIINENFPVYFHVNDSHESVQKLYNQALILWHGAGYGVDENRYPERTEHFGMSVVEAMSAKCLPIVTNRGGLKEIVQHGNDGFLWDTTDELMKCTIKVAGLSPDQLESLQRNARKRYQSFDLNSFNKRVEEFFSPFLVRLNLSS